MHSRIAEAAVRHLRQETQYTCVAASITSVLGAFGKNVTEADVNKVLGASAMHGARWEEALATLQYFGLRGNLVVPATIKMIKDWTDSGRPVIIAWNPEGRPWSHASVVFDVRDDLTVKVMDSNIPDPEMTERVVPREEFYKKWYEKWSDSLLIRRPALFVDREVTQEGRQVMASRTAAGGYWVGNRGNRHWKEWDEPTDADERRYQRKLDDQRLRERSNRLNMNFHIMLAAEARRLRDVETWVKGLSGSLQDMRFLAGEVDGDTIYVTRKVPSDPYTPEQIATYEALVKEHPIIESSTANVKTIQKEIGEPALEEAEKKAEAEQVAVERVLKQMESRYGGDWIAYDYAIADDPQDLGWEYQDEDGFHAHIRANSWSYRTNQITLYVYKGEPGAVRLAPSWNTDYGKLNLIQTVELRVRDKEKVVPLAMTHILRIKGSPDFSSESLQGEGSLRWKQKRQERGRAEEQRQQIQSQPAVKTTVDSATEEKIAFLNTLKKVFRGGQSEKDIIDSVIQTYAAGGHPDPDDLKAIRNYLYRSRMAPAANHFRQAVKKQTPIVLKKEDLPKHRTGPIEYSGAGTHQTREQDVEKGRSRKEKHRKPWVEKEMEGKEAFVRERLTWQNGTVVASVHTAGKVQDRINAYLVENPGPVEITNMVRTSWFRGINFKDIQQAIKVLARMGKVKLEGTKISKAAAIRPKVPEGTRVIVQANPASRMLYSGRLPDNDEAGSVVSIPVGRSSVTFMPGPGGGLIYVQFDNGTVMGVSPHDLILERDYRKQAGKVNGPGNPDGTGPKKDDPDCPYNKEAGSLPSGLYGYTKLVQASCESCSNSLKKMANRIARQTFGKDAEVVGFLQTHANRRKSESAKVLLAAMKDIGPRLASETNPVDKTAASEIGLYGFKHKTVDLGLHACRELRSGAGRIAGGLHTKKSGLHEKITSFFREHAKQAKCPYSRMLLGCYPDAPTKTASTEEAWIAWDNEPSS